MAPAAAAAEEEQQQQDQDEVLETQPLLVRQLQPAEQDAGNKQQSPGSPSKAAALTKQGSSSIGRVKSQELGQCR